VEGRLQGDPRPPRRAPVRLSVVATAAVAGAFAVSAVLEAKDVLPRVEDGIARDSKLTAVERRHAAGDRLLLRPGPFDAFRATLRPREHYAVDVPPGQRGPSITRGDVVRAYSAFYFLPAIQVPRAERVFHYRFR
jgi:hypothetical protein